MSPENKTTVSAPCFYLFRVLDYEHLRHDAFSGCRQREKTYRPKANSPPPPVLAGPTNRMGDAMMALAKSSFPSTRRKPTMDFVHSGASATLAAIGCPRLLSVRHALEYGSEVRVLSSTFRPSQVSRVLFSLSW